MPEAVIVKDTVCDSEPVTVTEELLDCVNDGVAVDVLEKVELTLGLGVVVADVVGEELEEGVADDVTEEDVLGVPSLDRVRELLAVGLDV